MLAGENYVPLSGFAMIIYNKQISLLYYCYYTISGISSIYSILQAIVFVLKSIVF